MRKIEEKIGYGESTCEGDFTFFHGFVINGSGKSNEVENMRKKEANHIKKMSSIKKV